MIIESTVELTKAQLSAQLQTLRAYAQTQAVVSGHFRE